jgi:hypothetical protein
MSYLEYTYLRRSYITSLIDYLDKVVDNLSIKIKNNKLEVEEALNKIVSLSLKIKSL